MTEEEKLLQQAILAKTGTGGGGGGGSTSPADIADGIDSSVDINTMLANLDLLLEYTDEVETLLGGIITNTTGKATEVTLAALLTELQLKANLAETQPVSIAQVIDSIISGNRVSYAPSYGAPDDNDVIQASLDSSGSLVTRSSILTDEGTYRVNFANTSLAVSIGTISNITGKIVTGTGFMSVDVHLKDYFKLDADPESAWKQIGSIDSDTQITLDENYVGGTSGAGSRALVQPSTGAGATITVLNGQGIITAGTTSNAVSFLSRRVDYAPLVFKTRLSISQRIANQNIRIGFAEASPTPRFFARFRCDGAVSTVNTTIICETGRNPTGVPSVAETETTSITLPNNVNTSQVLDYKIEHMVDHVRFYINNVLVAEHTKSLPSPYDYMASGTRIENVGVPASSTVITIDYASTKNHNKAEVGIMSDNERIVAIQPPLTPFNFSQAGVITINTDLLLIDCLQLRTINLQITSVGTTGVISTFLTNDLTVLGTAQPAYPIGGGAAVTTPLVAGHYNIPIHGARYLRVRLTTATTAGTTTLFASGSPFAMPLPLPTTQPVSGTVTSNIGTGTLSTVTTVTNVTNAGTPTVPATPYFINSLATTNGVLILTGTSGLQSFYATNNGASIAYVKLYNKATAPTVGTDIPEMIIAVPAAVGSVIGTATLPIGFNGFRFPLGLGIAITGLMADADTTAVAAGQVKVKLSRTI